MAADLGALGAVRSGHLSASAFFGNLATKAFATLRVTTVKPFVGRPARSWVVATHRRW
jgi:hypothetical protein